MATKATEAALVDTNVLLEASDTKRRHHADAVRLLEGHRSLFISAQVIREFLVVATRSVAKNGFALPLPTALESVVGFRRNLRLLPEEKPILPHFLALLAEGAYAGSQLHDVHLAATALTHKLSLLVTLNGADFASFKSRITIVSPRDLV